MTQKITRRALVQALCGGFGSVGLIGMLANEQASAATTGHYIGPRLPVKAKHVIFLFMGGGPSHIDMFDMKPDAPEGIREVRHVDGRPVLLPAAEHDQVAGVVPG